MSPIPEVFDLIIRLGIRDGVAPLPKTHPGRCWERDLGSGWWIALNGNREAVKCSKGIDVPPFTVYGERNGFPALLVGPKGGSVGGPGWGDLDLEGELIGILDKHIRKEGEPNG